MISYQTHAHVRDEVLCEEHGHIDVKGVARPVATYRVIDVFEDMHDDSGPIHATLPHFKLDLDVRLMSAAEQQVAAEVLREAARRLSP